MPEEKSPKTKSTVLRSGRFGVGVLAAFLLGSEVHVATRHIYAQKGVQFATNLSLDPIELKYDDTLGVGTTIRIALSAEAHQHLSERFVKSQKTWDWYCLDYPKVDRLIGTDRRQLPQRHKIVLQDLTAKSHWRKTEIPIYEGVYWTYGKGPSLACNGIRIRENAGGKQARQLLKKCASWGTGFHPIEPRIMVMDPDGALPLNLYRTGLTETRLPFEDKLLSDMTRDLISFLLAWMPEKPNGMFEPGIPAYDGTSVKKSLPTWLFTREGVTIFDAWVLELLKIQSVAFVPDPWSCSVIAKAGLNLSHDAIVAWTQTNGYRANILEILSDRVPTDRGTCKGLLSQSLISPFVRIIMDNYMTQLFKAIEPSDRVIIGESKSRFQCVRQIREQLDFEFEGQDYSILASKECPESLLSKAFLTKICSGTRGFTMMEMFFTDVAPTELTLLGREWRDLICQPIIPFDVMTRQHVLKDAFRLLKPFISAHTERKERGLIQIEKGRRTLDLGVY